MNYLIDIDGTVSDDIPNEENHRFLDARVLVDDNGVSAMEWVNKLYSDGHHITFFTAREEKDRDVTAQWLHKHGFHYHLLIMNKPRGGPYRWVDNLDVEGIKFSGVYPS